MLLINSIFHQHNVAQFGIIFIHSILGTVNISKDHMKIILLNFSNAHIFVVTAYVSWSMIFF